MPTIETLSMTNEGWQLGEIQQGILDIETGNFVAHEQVREWLESWGTPGETGPPE